MTKIEGDAASVPAAIEKKERRDGGVGRGSEIGDGAKALVTTTNRKIDKMNFSIRLMVLQCILVDSLGKYKGNDSDLH